MRLTPALANTDYDLFWITMDNSVSLNKVVFDTLASWVPDVKAKGKKVVVYGVTAKAWQDYPSVRQLLGD